MSKIEIREGVKNLVVDSEKDVNGYHLVDVRRPEEYSGELGHIKGAKLATLGPDLQTYVSTLSKNTKILFICRSGGRSTQACQLAASSGYLDVTNLAGGMLFWNQVKLSTEK